MAEHKVNIDISIIIVNYKTPKLLCDCIASVFDNQNGLSLEVIVVDNDSQDDSETLVKSKFSNVIWMEMKYNSGFSRANNTGIKSAKGNYILLLNSDTLIINDCLKRTYNYFLDLEKKNNKVGLLGCKMKDFNESLLFNSTLSFPGIKKLIHANPFYIWLFRKKIPPLEEVEKIKSEIHCTDHRSAWISSAFAFCNSNIFKNENLYLDEDFFMYFEDYEWCYRLIKRGYKNYFFPGAEIYHMNCGSTISNEWKISQVVISEWLYVRKTRGVLYYLFYIFALRLNLTIDQIFYKRKNKQIKLTNDDLSSLEDRKRIRYLLKNYSSEILKHYNRKISASKTFLKYHVNKD